MSEASLNDPDKYRIDANEPVVFPTNHLVAVLDTHDQALAAIEQLVGDGFSEASLGVSCGEARANALRDSTGRKGLANLAIRIADRLGVQNAEMEFKSHYEQALRDGHFVLGVEARGDEEKERGVEILKQHDAHAITYNGRLSIEAIVPPRQ